MAMIGMDVGQAQNYAGQLDTQAHQIDNVITAITGIVNHLVAPGVWQGTDATTFQSDWQHTHLNSLRAVSQEVSRIAALVRKNADAQTQTSLHQ